MSPERPRFMDSPYFVMEPNNWHLKDGAPESLRKEFDEFMRQTDMTKNNENNPWARIGKGKK